MIRRAAFLETLGTLFFAALLLFPANGLHAQADPFRDWTSSSGQPFKAQIVSFDGTTAVLKLPDGRRLNVKPADLGESDRRYLVEWRDRQPISVILPEYAGIEDKDLKIEVVSENPQEDRFIYRSPHFEFESQGKFTQGLLRDVARNFEATYALLKALPWGIDPVPPEGGYFRAKLFTHRELYFAEGAPKNSGGVYMPNKKLFMVPFSSIGLKVVGNSYAKDRDYNSETLVHELTHQMMDSWLGLLPSWVVEGTAEYTSILPLRAGRFRVSAARTGLNEYLSHLKESSGIPQPYPLANLFEMGNFQWNSILATDPDISRRLYFTSYLMVFYFMHMEGDGDGQLFIRYLRAVDKMRREMIAYLANPGSASKPSALDSPDEFIKSTLNILLNGRTVEELNEQIRSAYAKRGIRL